MSKNRSSTPNPDSDTDILEISVDESIIELSMEEDGLINGDIDDPLVMSDDETIEILDSSISTIDSTFTEFDEDTLGPYKPLLKHRDLLSEYFNKNPEVMIAFNMSQRLLLKRERNRPCIMKHRLDELNDQEPFKRVRKNIIRHDNETTEMPSAALKVDASTQTDLAHAFLEGNHNFLKNCLLSSKQIKLLKFISFKHRSHICLYTFCWNRSHRSRSFSRNRKC